MAATAEIQQPPPAEPPIDASTITCKFWAEGHCFRGATCWYRHGNHNATSSSHPAADGQPSAYTSVETRISANTNQTAPTPITEPDTHPKATLLRAEAPSFLPSMISPPELEVDQAESQAAIATESSKDFASIASEPAPHPPEPYEPPNCLICYEIPATYGLLDSCSHPFCLSCIRKWRLGEDRREAVVLSGANKRCPMCRGSCLFITPSSTFYANGTAKDTAVQRYKASLSSKPCRFFDATKNSSRGPFCKFGDDCHYAHTLVDGDDRYHFGGGFEAMAATARRRREERERRNRPGRLQRALEQLDELMDSDIWVGEMGPLNFSNGNDPADWDRIDADLLHPHDAHQRVGPLEPGSYRHFYSSPRSERRRAQRTHHRIERDWHEQGPRATPRDERVVSPDDSFELVGDDADLRSSALQAVSWPESGAQGGGDAQAVERAGNGNGEDATRNEYNDEYLANPHAAFYQYEEDEQNDAYEDEDDGWEPDLEDYFQSRRGHVESVWLNDEEIVTGRAMPEWWEDDY